MTYEFPLPAGFSGGTLLETTIGAGTTVRVVDDRLLIDSPRSEAEVQAAVDAHPNPVPLPVEDQNMLTLHDRLVTGYDAMKTHVDRGTFTAAQRDAALLLVLRVCMGLVRVVLRRLDATD